MAIERDDGVDRHARIERMIDACREAQSHRPWQPTDKMAEMAEATWSKPRSASTRTPARNDGSAR